MDISLQQIHHPAAASAGAELYLLRLDLIHPRVSGNKYFKLKYNLEEMRGQEHDTLLTFGGAFSNHILATAAAGKEYGFKTIGMIRGGELDEKSNVVLETVAEYGMRLHFVAREQYRKKNEPSFLGDLKKRFGRFYLLPEGGSNLLAVKGCAEIMQEVKIDFDFVACAVGTGATLAGIASSLSPGQQALGFAVLADARFLDADVDRFIEQYTGRNAHNVRMIHDYHFGRYGRITKELENFIADFEKRHGIPLDPVYTGKMMYGLIDLLKKGFFIGGEKIIAVHTGGLHPAPKK